MTNKDSSIQDDISSFENEVQSTIDNLEKENTSSEITNNITSIEQSSQQESVENNDVVIYKDAEWRKHPQDFKLIAFTFDDAPSYPGTRNNTTSMIDIMKKYHGSGTIFVVGNNIAENGVEVLKYALDNGFELGNHTYDHRSVATDNIGKMWTSEEHYNDFKRCQDLVYEHFGIQMKWFRPSGLDTNDALFEATEKLGLPCISYSVGTNDWNSETSGQDIKESVLLNAHDGGIVLMHGWANNSRIVLDEICQQLYNDGYRFCTLSELFEFKGIDYNQIPCNRVIRNYSRTILY